jgi:hypothetical protein
MGDPFVILLHTGWGESHYDLMLSAGAALATWQLGDDPAGLGEGSHMPATRLGDHRPAYLTYEGPVSNGRGSVRRVCRGTYERLAAAEGVWLVRLAGDACRGRFELRRIGADTDRWRLRRLPDADA